MIGLIRKIILVLVVVCAVGALGYNKIKKPTCETVGQQKVQESSHGLLYWNGPNMLSFAHSDNPVCVARDWEPLGYVTKGNGWARYIKDKSGVMIKSDEFVKKVVKSKGGTNEISIFYPINISRDESMKYISIVQNVFDRVESIYPKPTETQKIDVLVTAGLAGSTSTNRTRIYPDPSESLMFVFYKPEYYRSNELLIHAAMHTYNRFRTDFTEYLKHQEPFGVDEWSELEATWAETAFNDKTLGRLKRIDYLYNVHTAVRTGNFKLITEAPFNDKEGFEKINQTVMVKMGSQFLDYQYGHYVLAPLSMIAVDGMLYGHKSHETVETILTKIHKDPSINFVNEISKILTKKEVADFISWTSGQKTVPMNMVFLMAQRYNARQ